MAKKKKQSDSVSKSHEGSDYLQAILIYHNLGKAVKLLSYWTSNIENFIKNSQQLHKLEQELKDKTRLIE